MDILGATPLYEVVLDFGTSDGPIALRESEFHNIRTGHNAKCGRFSIDTSHVATLNWDIGLAALCELLLRIAAASQNPNEHDLASGSLIGGPHSSAFVLYNAVQCRPQWLRRIFADPSAAQLNRIDELLNSHRHGRGAGASQELFTAIAQTALRTSRIVGWIDSIEVESPEHLVTLADACRAYAEKRSGTVIADTSDARVDKLHACLQLVDSMGCDALSRGSHVTRYVDSAKQGSIDTLPQLATALMLRAMRYRDDGNYLGALQCHARAAKAWARAGLPADEVHALLYVSMNARPIDHQSQLNSAIIRAGNLILKHRLAPLCYGQWFWEVSNIRADYGDPNEALSSYEFAEDVFEYCKLTGDLQEPIVQQYLDNLRRRRGEIVGRQSDGKSKGLSLVDRAEKGLCASGSTTDAVNAHFARVTILLAHGDRKAALKLFEKNALGFVAGNWWNKASLLAIGGGLFDEAGDKRRAKALSHTSLIWYRQSGCVPSLAYEHGDFLLHPERFLRRNDAVLNSLGPVPCRQPLPATLKKLRIMDQELRRQFEEFTSQRSRVRFHRATRRR